MILDEPDRFELLDAVLADDERLWSPMSCWETVSALRSNGKLAVHEARTLVEGTAQTLELKLVEIGRKELSLALDAYEIFGKGSGHGAKLNMGDCFAYGCAKANNARLLYKGNDFARTDLA